ncbi:MAG: hypothetical protein HOO96_41625 [Polyangiaceae bacterium]|nr:hypothetical protein [Polyangiaceae bacterium]
MAKKTRALSALPLTPAFVVVLAACGGGTPEPQPPMVVANPPATHEVTPDNPPRLGDEHVGPKPEPTAVPTAAPDVKPPSMDTNPPQPQPSATGTAKPAPTAKPKGKTPKPG